MRQNLGGKFIAGFAGVKIVTVRSVRRAAVLFQNIVGNFYNGKRHNKSSEHIWFVGDRILNWRLVRRTTNDCERKNQGQEGFHAVKLLVTYFIV